jgi:catechol 2,3-dioxygenase
MAQGSAAWTDAPNGYRLPGDIRLGVVQLQVADLTRSVQWYERVLGLKLRQGSGSSALLGTATGTPLVELHERLGATPVPRRGRLGLFHFAILLPDRPALGRFLTHLGSLDERVGASDHLVSEATYLTDPDGLGIEVYADRPRETWKMDGNRLAMGTLPLDVNSVIQSADGVPWAGIPNGTRMGHLHLHVGDIDRAAAFYHQGLGLERVVLDYPGALFMSAGGYHHHLGTNTWATGALPPEERDARLLEWNIALPSAADVAAASGSLAAAGFSVQRDPGSAAVVDPWGTALRLRANT